MEEKDKKEDYYLVFESGGYFFAARLSQIQKVYEGEEVPEGRALDFGKLLGIPQSAGKYYLEVLVSGKTVPVLVDKIEPIKNFQLAVWLDFPRVMRRQNNEMIKGFFFDGARMISLIDFEQVFKR